MITGLYPDPPDPRDLLLRRVLPRGPVVDAIDYSDCMAPVRSQFDEGTCAAFAGAAMKEAQERKDCGLDCHLSPRYLYWRAKLIDGLDGVEGTTLRAIMKTLYDYGICLEETWPYVANHAGRKPNHADKEAEDYKIFTYAKLTSLLDMERCLAQKGPFPAGFDIWSGWMDAKETIPDPPRRFMSMGGHGVCVVGFNRHKKKMLLRNSWGEDWGVRGYSEISYYHIQRCFISAWSSIDIKGSINPRGAKK